MEKPQISPPEYDFSKQSEIIVGKASWHKMSLRKAFVIGWIVSPLPFGMLAAPFILGAEFRQVVDPILLRFKRSKVPKDIEDLNTPKLPHPTQEIIKPPVNS